MTEQPVMASSDPPISSIPPDLEAVERVLPTVSDYLAKGLDLKRWWDEATSATGDIPDDKQFPLVRAYNRATRAYGFFGEANVGGKTMPIMGNLQEMFYDQIHDPHGSKPDHVEWMRGQLEEFVMRYFMRISSFHPPDVFVDKAHPTAPPALAGLSLCPKSSDAKVGFGFEQLFCKSKDSGAIDSIPSYDRYRIIDQRDIGSRYEWLLLKVNIFDFAVRFPLSGNGPQLVTALDESSYLVAHEAFIRHVLCPPNLHGGHFEILGDYGVGYAFIKNPTQGLFGYGPGEFEAAIELINFRIYKTGYISVRMVFIANRPTQIMNLVVDPVDWSFKLADVFSLGLASKVFGPAKDILDRLPLRFSFDPVPLYLSGANMALGATTAQNLCISMDTLEKLFLQQHFRQHYETVLGSLITWRQIPDWTKEEAIRTEFPWIDSGITS